jgi:hypothetical protein
MNDEQIQQEETPDSPSEGNRGLKIVVVLLLCAAIAGFLYARHERSKAARLAAGYDQMSMTLNQTRGQLRALAEKLNALSAPQPPAPAPVAAPAPKAAPRPVARTRRHPSARAQAKPRPADDPRWKQVQAELAEHQKQIDAARQDVAETRTELEGRINSSHDELSGSIARTHEELVALQKRGERNYAEFDMQKSKYFQRIGPISIALRKTNRKHQYCDLKLLVDDHEITRKHVNLYEPVLLYPADYAQPLELVINRIEKNQARGYVSSPKYRQSELAAMPAPSAASTAATPLPPAGTTSSLEHRTAMPQ